MTSLLRLSTAISSSSLTSIACRRSIIIVAPTVHRRCLSYSADWDTPTSASSNLAHPPPPPAAAVVTPVVPLAAPRRARAVVTSAQLRAQRPRASKAAAASNPDTSLAADSCGPVLPGPEMVSVVNSATGERLGPRGLEPTRYGDWESKGRCWDF